MQTLVEKYKPGEISRDPKRVYKISCVYTDHGIVSESTRALTREDLAGISNTIHEVIGKNDVASYIFFMYNRWSKEMCEEIFRNNGVCSWEHIWDKYEIIAEECGCWAAPFRWFCELNDELQDILTSYIVKHQDRRKRIC